MQLVHLNSIETKREISVQGIENNDSIKQKSLVGEDIREENSETNLSTQVKNQLKNTDQIKKIK